MTKEDYLTVLKYYLQKQSFKYEMMSFPQLCTCMHRYRMEAGKSLLTIQNPRRRFQTTRVIPVSKQVAIRKKMKKILTQASKLKCLGKLHLIANKIVIVVHIFERSLYVSHGLLILKLHSCLEDREHEKKNKQQHTLPLVLLSLISPSFQHVSN